MSFGDRMNEEVTYPPERNRRDSYVQSMEEYRKVYRKSITDPEGFWSEYAREFFWKRYPTGDFVRYNFDISKGPIFASWMEGGLTNVCYNVLDRNIFDKGLGDKIAYYWEGNDPEYSRTVTYRELLKEVCKFANVLKSKGIKKGDHVAVYLPMVIELAVVMLACARLGVVHTIVFGGFSSKALADRMLDANACLLVTADGAWRGTKLIPLKTLADEAIEICRRKGLKLKGNIVLKHLKTPKPKTNGMMDDKPITQPSKRLSYDIATSWNADIDTWWHHEMEHVTDFCEPEWVESEHPLFLLYTSGSTGKPKGVVHSTAGYMLYGATTFKYTFDYHLNDIYFCTADIGWVTGHTFSVYGSLAQGASCILFEGTPFHPDPGRFWAIVEKYKVTTFYTAPTAIRSLMKFGDSYVKKHNRDSLRIIGTAGEPINPEAWRWYYTVVGESRCSLVDTFWQTETGATILTPLPGCTPTKPGSATFPFFGVIPAIVNDDGKEIEGPGEGHFVIKKPWPGMLLTIHGAHDRFEVTYFKRFPGYFFTGDGARRDEDGYFWVTGRVDDMLNVSGHLLSTAEVETALLEHRAIAETAVVSHPHPIKGECLYCFLVMKEGVQYTKEVEYELKEKVRSKIGAFATPEYIQVASALPKTRSGKIMRRLLRQVSRNDRELGDVSSLADDHIIEELFTNRCLTAA